MPSSNEGFSDTDSDDVFNADMEAIKRSCQITGANHDLQPSADLCGGCTVSASSEAESDGDDDIALVRSIQKRFASSTDMEEPLTLKPLCTLPPDSSDSDECDEDYETLRAIQRRFAAYNGGDLKNNVKDALHRRVQVGIIDSEKETSNNLFGERTNAREGFLNCVDSREPIAEKSVACDDVSGIQSSNLFEQHEQGAVDATEFPFKSSNFPKSALTFVDAIKKNRSCQKLIRSKMIQMGARINELDKLMERVKILKDFHVACKKKTGRALSRKRDARVQLISLPKLRGKTKSNEKNLPAVHNGPPENIHVSVYKDALAAFPDSMVREKWSKEESENLEKGVKQQFQEMLLQRSVDLFSCVDGSSGDSNNIDSIILSIKDLELDPEKIRLFLPKVNWEQLAAMYVLGRSGAECQARFLNFEDPLVNHNPWTAMEDKSLLHIVQQRGLNNWIDIAVSLGTNRTPFQCLARYQRSLNASILKREWTKEADDQLRSAVETFGESNWQLIASVIEGRTGTQCSNRWMKTLHPARQRVGQWTSEEDKRMKIAVTLFGPKTWKKVAECVPGRTQVQCRERWVNCLDPSLNMARWTEEEDSKLEAAIAEYGYCWSKVAACVPPRTDNQCRRRWKVLFPHEVPVLQAARKIQKAALISNFVDRESERPTLGPNDFLSPETYSLTGSKNMDLSSRKRKSRETCSDNIPRLTNGWVENMQGRSISRKGRAKRSHSMKKKTDPLSETHFSPFPEMMLLDISNGEMINESTLGEGDPWISSVLREEKATFNVKSTDRSKRTAARCQRKRSSEQSSETFKYFDTIEECPRLLSESDLPTVTMRKGMSEFGRDEASQLRKASESFPRRRSSKLLEQAPEIPIEVDMPIGGADILKRQEEIKADDEGIDATDGNTSPFPDSMPLMDIVKGLRAAKAVKARNKIKQNQEPLPASVCVAPSLCGDDVHLSPTNMKTKTSDKNAGCVAGICCSQPIRSNNGTVVLKDFECSVTSTERYNRIQNVEKAELPSQNHSI